MESSLFNYLNLINEVHENVAPRTFKEAMKSPDSAEWRKAIHAEIKSLLELGTWEKVKKSDMPPGKKCKTGAFIFKRKYTGDTNVRFKYKARLVAHGYTQLYGLDYWETYTYSACYCSSQQYDTSPNGHRYSVSQFSTY